MTRSQMILKKRNFIGILFNKIKKSAVFDNCFDGKLIPVFCQFSEVLISYLASCVARGDIV